MDSEEDNNESSQPAPFWQRLFMGLLAVLGALSICSGFEVDDFSFYSLVKFAFSLLGLHAFATVAITGRLPRWLDKPIRRARIHPMLYRESGFQVDGKDRRAFSTQLKAWLKRNS